MEKEEFLKLVNTTSEHKPTLLLHACCAPCSSYVLEYLNSHFDITLYFYNPNIYPMEEYNIRAEELKKLVADMKLDIKVVVEDYDDKEFYSAVKGLEQEKEGGERCRKCFTLRLNKAYDYARNHSFDYFTTTLSISPYKNSKVLNEVGENVVDLTHDVKWLYSNFKLKDGYKRSIELSHIYNLYRQDYCGCVYSLMETKRRREQRANEDNR